MNKKLRILFTGDSITDANRTDLLRQMEEWLRLDPNMTGERRDELTNSVLGSGYPLLAAAQLTAGEPEKYQVLNRGISGNRIVDLDARIKADCINLAPDVLSIMIGINDVWHEVSGHNGVDAVKFERVYDYMLEEVRAALPELRLILLEPYVLQGPSTQESWEYFRHETDLRQEVVRRLAEKHNAACIDTQAMFNRASAASSPCVYTADGVHPTPAGHWLLAQEWLRVFREA